MLRIKHLDQSDAASALRWDAFVGDCPEATFFHRSPWQKIIGEVFRHPAYFLYAEDDRGIRGILPLAHVNSLLFGNALVALPFAVYGGVAAVDAEAVAALEDAAQDTGAQTRRGPSRVPQCGASPCGRGRHRIST